MQCGDLVRPAATRIDAQRRHLKAGGRRGHIQKVRQKFVAKRLMMAIEFTVGRHDEDLWFTGPLLLPVHLGQQLFLDITVGVGGQFRQETGGAGQVAIVKKDCDTPAVTQIDPIWLATGNRLGRLPRGKQRIGHILIGQRAAAWASRPQFPEAMPLPDDGRRVAHTAQCPKQSVLASQSPWPTARWCGDRAGREHWKRLGRDGYVVPQTGV